MKTITKRTLALVAISSIFLPWQGAAASKGDAASTPLPNTQLHARHPSALVGRGHFMQTEYVDLYGPLTPGEAERLAGYRDGEGRRLPAPDAQP